MDDPLIQGLETAVAAQPDNVELRLHLARLLVDAGRGGDAVPHVATALQQRPDDPAARELMAQALGTPPAAAGAEPPVPPVPPAPPAPPARQRQREGFDWSAAETDLGDVVPAMFVDGQGENATPAFDVDREHLTLADVGGMREVKRRLNAAFLAPMRNPELRRTYAKSLRGGLLLYGPPGCGKTFVARALAGELGAGFMTVSLADVLDMYIGQSEKNVHEIFETARTNAPVLLFLDEVDAIGHKRSRTSSDGIRNAVNQLLLELDSVGDDNEGVFVLAATNHPWDVDPALRRPGRLDRTLLVLPPDAEAREAIWTHHLRGRPIQGIDVRRLVKASDGYTGADIAHVVDSAAELALLDAAESGELRLIAQADVERALAEVRPSIGPWFETAKNVALFANEGGSYDELLAYLRKTRRL
ncbi:AAA family ATPase [Nocardioides mangrovicus]|uniref:AAA family ATPase n=1 Tax=Nocardioides mangrovicus TaxID=2478913 RepID=A0A3L8P1E7_9ACTN|nr:AAA family ATPase [Nocardioides mangrovicus]RLV48742.1 AAA family ATPase [Nocardioides mangrovicus]